MREIVHVWGSLSHPDWEILERHIGKLTLTVWKWEYIHLRAAFEGCADVCARITYDSWEMDDSWEMVLIKEAGYST